MGILYADWPAPEHIVAGVTDRCDGYSKNNFASNNVALHVEDDPVTVIKNRQLLRETLIQEHELSSDLQWQWLNQVHGKTLVDANDKTVQTVPVADASVTATENIVCAVMTADCLPILITDKAGEQVAAIHAGWRSLCFGIIEETIANMREKRADAELLVWLGPAIGPTAFEVGADVLQAFEGQNCGDLAAQAFVPQADGKYLADIYQLASMRLKALGVNRIYGGGLCTVSDEERFYSYRRDGVTGRMVSFILIKQ